MLRLTLISLFALLFFQLQSQIISLFEFNTPSLITATVGPDASSISSSAFSDVGGTGGTNGLNAGLPKMDFDMIVPGSPTFDINGIDVSFDYQREENVGHFWRRGSSLVISGAANLSVSYRVEDGLGGFITVNSGNVYAIPNDDTYRNYRFVYLPASGTGMLMVDNTVVWSNDGPDFRNMYWVGAGDVHIGDGLDGNGDNNAFLDNVQVGEVTVSPLPIELYTFDALLNPDGAVEVSWATASERDNDFFTVEKSHDGAIWSEVGKIQGAGNSSQLLYYELTDENVATGLTYYRLKQTDFSGKEVIFAHKVIHQKPQTEVLVYPNPLTLNTPFHVSIGELEIKSIQITDAQGRTVPYTYTLNPSGALIHPQNWDAGCFLVHVQTESGTLQKRIVIH
jgi:hypothetical protein